MTDNMLFARVIPYYVSREVLSRSIDGTGVYGLDKRTQTPLGNVTRDTNFSQLDGIVEGTPFELIRGEPKTLKVGTSEGCDIILPTYLDYVGKEGFGVQAKIRYDGQNQISVEGNARWTNRVDGHGLTRREVFNLQPDVPHLVALGDWFVFNSEQQQTQAVLKIEYKH